MKKGKFEKKGSLKKREVGKKGKLEKKGSWKKRKFEQLMVGRYSEKNRKRIIYLRREKKTGNYWKRMR